jgi:hypothetical protein
MLRLLKVEMLIRKHSLNQPEMLQYPIQIAEEALTLAKKVYGDKALVTNQTMLNYAVALTLNSATKE